MSMRGIRGTAEGRVKLLDLLDVHFYSMARGLGIGKDGQTDPATAALRIRATRSLWDPNYVDESWINERMRVLPLLREWIAQHHPGLGISIGEWNFGAETHMSGGLATAEVLGRFGTEGVTSAYYWTDPAPRSPAFWPFRAFRNFDDAGCHFLDWTVPAKGDVTLASMFSSRRGGRHVVPSCSTSRPSRPSRRASDWKAAASPRLRRSPTPAAGRVQKRRRVGDAAGLQLVVAPTA